MKEADDHSSKIDKISSVSGKHSPEVSMISLLCATLVI